MAECARVIDNHEAIMRRSRRHDAIVQSGFKRSDANGMPAATCRFESATANIPIQDFRWRGRCSEGISEWNAAIGCAKRWSIT
jgi:hypothetical protein